MGLTSNVLQVQNGSLRRSGFDLEELPAGSNPLSFQPFSFVSLRAAGADKTAAPPDEIAGGVPSIAVGLKDGVSTRTLRGAVFVSFPDPHHPFNPPGNHWSMYQPEQFDLDLPFSAHENPPPPLRYLREGWEQGASEPTPFTAFHADDQALREAMALTAGMITIIDDRIGEVMAALEASGQTENTIVIFTSDHGDYLGDYNLLLKGPLPTRAITRVPFIWADPSDRQQRCSNALASTIDISATILARAGIAPYWGMQGRSLLPSVRRVVRFGTPC